MGVVGSALISLAVLILLQRPLTLLLDQFFGIGEWQTVFATYPFPAKLAALALKWIAPIALGQLLSAYLSGWAEAVFFAAVIQTVHLLTNYSDPSFAALWLLPAMVSLAMVKAKWAAAGAKKGQAFEAKWSTGRNRI
jgi:hypothetical protein